MGRVDVNIIEFKNPGVFYGCEESDDVTSEDFYHLDKLINEYYNNEQMISITYHAQQNEICIARRLCDNRWYRVRVEAIYNRRHGPEASCYFLDTGKNEMVPTQWIRKAAPDFLTIPYQVKTYCLYGVKALTLAIHEDLSVKMEQCIHWDSSAISFVHQYMKETHGTQVETKYIDGSGIHYVLLYLHTRNGEVCLNDELVRNKYGTKIDTDVGVGSRCDSTVVHPAPIKSSRTIETELKRLKLKKSKLKSFNTEMPALSDIDLSSTDLEEDCSVISSSTNPEHTQINVQHSRKDVVTKKPAFSPISTTNNNAIDSMSFVKNILSRTSPESSSSEMHQNRDHKVASILGSPVQRNTGRYGMLDRMRQAVKSPRSTPACVSDSELVKSCPPCSSNKMWHTDASSSDANESGFLRKISTRKATGKSFLGSGGSEGVDVSKLVTGDTSVSLVKSRIPQCIKNRGGQSSSGSDSECGQNHKVSSILKEHIVSDEGSPLGSSINKTLPSYANRISARFLGEISEEFDINMKKSEMVSKLQGNRLLESLSAGSAAVISKNAGTSEVREFSKVWVESSLPNNPYYKIEEAPLAPIIKKIFTEENFISPRHIQAYAWPGIFRGSHVIGLSPAKSGKTYAYLAPLVTELLRPSSYSDLPIGNGPIALILVHSWRKAQEIFDVTLRLLQEAPKIRPLILYGGGCEDNQFLPLINGCEILIATPPSLGRVMRDRYTDLDRLCHLVIDDADTLLELYTEEVQNLMSAYAKVFEKSLHRSAPHQMIMMATQWCQAIESFANAFIADPVIILNSSFEASVYHKVKQEVHICRPSERASILIDLLDSIVTDGIRVIIFTSIVNDVIHIMKLLSSHSLYALQVHHDMDPYLIQQTSIEWKERTSKNAVKLLVCTDSCIPTIAVSDAHVVIHYDLSTSRTRFGNRMACMNDHYRNSTENSSKSNEQNAECRVPTSHIILTEDCTEHVDTLIQFLKRTKSKIPQRLKVILADRKQKLEHDEDKELCIDMKAFGICKLKKCQSRHVILPKVDQPSNKDLTSGEVKVIITNVISASHCCVRVLEHRTPSGTVDMSASYLLLAGEIEKWFTTAGQRIKHTNICSGDVCAIEEDGVFHRVQILDIIGINSPKCTIQARVWYVDDGRRFDVAAKRLYELPSHLKSLPFQTMDMYICRVQPVDKDESWTANANTFTHELLKGKVLDGRIVLSLGNTLWLDPVVQRRYLKDLQTTVNEMFVRSELLKKGFAVDNPNHLQLLYNSCRGKIEIPEINKQSLGKNKSIETDKLPESKEFHDVYLSAVDMPDLIFLQRQEFAKRMEMMVDDINERFKDVDTTANVAAKFTKDCVCLGRFTQDNRWYRVRILNLLDEDMYEVLYVDFGDKEVVGIDRLYEMPPECTDLPLMAIECQLANVFPRGDEWREESGDCLWDMSHTVQAEKKLLIAKVVSKLKPQYTGVDKYEVELYDTSTANDVDFAQELVWSGLASPKQETNLKELCPRPPYLAMKVYRNIVQKIPDLCACIYWNSDQKRMWTPQQEILETVTQVAKSSPMNLVNFGGIAPIIKLIGRIVDQDIHRCLLEALLRAAESSDRLAEEILNQDGPHSIIQCLEQKSRPRTQEEAILAIERLVTADPRFVTGFSDVNVLEILCDLLDSEMGSEIVAAASTTLSSICKSSKNASELVYHFKLCSQIQRCLQATEDLTETRALLQLLATLVERNRNQEQLYREKLVRTVAAKMEMFYQDEECMKFGALFCENFCHSNRKHKTLLLEHGMAIILKKALTLPFSKSVYDRCSRFHDSLVVRVPRTEVILNHPLDTNTLDDQHGIKSIIPPVHWSQNIYRVMLNVKVRGINTEDNPVIITEKTFTFRARVDKTVYVVRYELYDKIIPSMCHTNIKVNEVLVSLRKTDKGKWPRLLRQKGKQQNLSVDFERFVDSSSDSDLCDDEQPFVLKKKKKPRKFPKDLPKSKNSSAGHNPTEMSLSSDSSNSSEDEIYQRDMTEDRDPYDIFGTKS